MSLPPSDYDLHDPALLRAGEYWACAHPERPPSSLSTIDPWCRACVIALGAGVVNCGAHGVRYGDPGEELEDIDAAAMYERLRDDLGLPSLRVGERGV